MTDVFISYSRKDKAFVRALCHALQLGGHQLWVDWDGIRSSLPWREEIARGIRQATRCVYILSPDAISSPYCNWEIDQVLEQQKKLIPIICYPVEDSTIRPEIAALQYISFCGEDDFISALNKLEGAINADLEYDRMFAKLIEQATAWVRRDRADGWLRGAVLEDAETWLANSTGKTPLPTDLQREFIFASRRERQQELERWENLYKIAEQRRIAAEKNEITAFCKSSEAYFALNRPLDALVEALQAGQRLQRSDWRSSQPSELHTQVVAGLQQSLYWVRERNRFEGHSGSVRAVSISPDGTLIATAGRDQTIRLWQRSGQCMAILSGHEQMVRTVAFSPDGQTLISGSWDQTIRIWTCQGELLQILKNHHGRINQLAFAQDGQHFASASQDGTVKLWTAAGQLIQSWSPGAGEQRSVAFSPDGNRIASANGQGDVFLWSRAADETFSKTLSFEHMVVHAVCFSPDGNQLLVAGENNKCLQIQLNHDYQVRNVAVQDSAIRCAQYLPDGDQFLTGNLNGKLSVWNSDGTHQATFEGHSGPIMHLDIDQTGGYALTAGGDRLVRFWELRTPLLVRCHLGNRGSYGLGFNPSGDLITVCYNGDSVQIWHRDGRLQHQFVAHKSGLVNLCTSPDGDLIATAGRSCLIKLWTPEGQLHALLKGHQDWPRQLCFSPDGLTLASASTDRTVRLWHRDGTLIRQITAGDSKLTSVRFSPDGQYVAAGTRDRTIKLWHIDGTLQHTFIGHEDQVLDLAFTPDGQHLISGSDDRTARIWTLDGTLVTTLPCQRSVRTVAISPDGQLIATGCRDSNIRLWSLAGEALSRLQAQSGQVLRVGFSSDGQYLATTGDAGILTVWHLDTFDDGLLDRLIQRGLDWCQDYLTHNPAGQTYHLLGQPKSP